MGKITTFGRKGLKRDQYRLKLSLRTKNSCFCPISSRFQSNWQLHLQESIIQLNTLTPPTLSCSLVLHCSPAHSTSYPAPFSPFLASSSPAVPSRFSLLQFPLILLPCGPFLFFSPSISSHSSLLQSSFSFFSLSFISFFSPSISFHFSLLQSPSLFSLAVSSRSTLPQTPLIF